MLNMETVKRNVLLLCNRVLSNHAFKARGHILVYLEQDAFYVHLVLNLINKYE